MYNSNIGTTLLGYKDKKDIQSSYEDRTNKYQKPLTPLPHFEIEKVQEKTLIIGKKVLYYGIRKMKNIFLQM